MARSRRAQKEGRQPKPDPKPERPAWMKGEEALVVFVVFSLLVGLYFITFSSSQRMSSYVILCLNRHRRLAAGLCTKDLDFIGYFDKNE